MWHGGSGATTRKKRECLMGQGVAGSFDKDPEFHE